MSKFKIGDVVEWSSQAGSYTTKKRGEIVAVFDPESRISSTTLDKFKTHRIMFDGGLPRKDESYFVSVPGKTERSMPKLYWPRTTQLKKVKKP